MSAIRTLGDRIAVRMQEGPGMVGAIHIPDATKSTRNQTFVLADVVSAGPQVEQARAGQVLVSEYFGDEIELAGEKLRIGRERDIVGMQTKAGVVPVGDRMHVRKLEPARMAGGLHLPEDVRAQQFQAVVLHAGHKAMHGMKAGDRVLVPKSVSVEIRGPDGQVTFHLVDEPALLAIIT